MTRFAALLFLAPLGAQDRVVEAITDIDQRDRVGQQPYEMTWIDRREDPRTLVDFEDLTKWRLELYNGAQGELRRSREEQMWGQYVAKITYRGAAAKSRVVARPPKPVPIPERFDSIDLWGYGDRVRYGAPRGAPVHLALLVVDARGLEHRVELNEIRWVGWWLIHRRLPNAVRERLEWPAAFSGLEIEIGEKVTDGYFFCDSLAFYTEKLEPLQFEPQPKRNLKPFRAQVTGLNTGEGTLPFPTREETILPENRESEFKVSVREFARRRFRFEYRGRDATVTYEYSPQMGQLGEITARVNAYAPFLPLEGGGLRFADTPEGEAARGRLVSVRLEEDAVKARFDFAGRQADFELRLWQKSLVVDVWCETGDATGLRFGRVAQVRNPRLITVPYITYSQFNPRVLLSGEPGQEVFTSAWFDWYRSNASAPHFVSEPKVDAGAAGRRPAGTAEINGELRYIAKTDGQRNPLYERLFVTVSPQFEEVLPTIANPPSQRQEEGKQVVWTVTQPQTWAADHARSRRIRSYGLDKIMQHSHEVTWRDHADSYTMRLKAAPQKGGDEALKWYIAAQTKLGWLQGVYSNYCDFAPVNTNWNPDWVQRMPDGEWRRAWYRTYALKPAKAVEMDAYYAPRIKEKFGVQMSYTDVHTDNPPPWEYTDYDARVPGAGTFAATYYAYGQLLLNDQKIYGPTQSESTFQWLFAGLQSGGYGWVYTDVNLLTHPLDVAFKLYKIHPLECDYGMGYTHYYLDRIDPKWKDSPRRRDYVDLFLATTIGYGNMGWLVTDWGLDDEFGVEAMARSYYMLQQLQQQYAFSPPRVVEYADEKGRLWSPSQAHANGALKGSRLHVQYTNGTHVWVHRGTEGTWDVPGKDGQNVTLPVNGWFAWNPGSTFEEFSGLLEGRRVDWVQSAGYEYLDGRGQYTERPRLAAKGAVARRERANGVVELISVYGNDRIGFAAEGAGDMQVFGGDGNLLGVVAVREPRAGWKEFTPVVGGRLYLWQPGGSARP